MTVYSKTIGREEFGVIGFGKSRARRAVSVESNRSGQAIKTITPVFKLNLILLFVAVLTLIGYVFLSNFLTSQKYALNLRKYEFNQLSALSAADNRNATDKQDLNGLMIFAQKSGMVEAKDIGVILEDGNFALSR